MDICAHHGAGDLLQQARSAHTQVTLVWHAGDRVDARNNAIVTQAKAQDIAILDETKYRLQQVVTVRPATDHAQHQIEFGRRGIGCQKIVHD